MTVEVRSPRSDRSTTKAGSFPHYFRHVPVCAPATGPDTLPVRRAPTGALPCCFTSERLRHARKDIHATRIHPRGWDRQ
ncbi:hypothetical protein SLNWT_3220 [Streptomyces albus]|uniref:Uncharacterized protein n=1 Tax=Streptomyces albus (strain ATCC 21838 / DSM 41398 / FERM P-419 / JCM 4703 / NBRC 107858) TaxID=1081613 RepID=A0A0B5EY87_STRA4|nr:hypothetical protein SLNWT_3220 [Streptomyces albus]AOU77903.1 hypothetical protein SLNHY_3212 [Streptomyces albus]AYN33658.1 hypothetical protein DUI70_3157 [Streptomyces albus]